MRTLANSEDLDEIAHFIRVYAACFDKKDPQRKKYNVFRNYKLWTLDIMNHPKFIASNQKEESI